MDLQKQGIKVVFTNLHGQPKDMLERFNLVPGLVELEFCFETFADATAWLESYLKKKFPEMSAILPVAV